MDSRERNHQWYDSFDPKKMTLTLRSGEVVPARYEVCSVCEGKGSHVNPSIDSHGLSREDFDEDPDFAEDYFAGNYDVQCYTCHGEKVVPTFDEQIGTREQSEMVHDAVDEHYSDQREQEWERRMGW